MTTLVMLHDTRQLPEVWRNIADYVPVQWGVVAPELHDCESIEAMVEMIERDLAPLDVVDPLLFVAVGAGVIPAVAYCAAHPGKVKAIMLSGPKLAVTRGDVRGEKLHAALHRSARESLVRAKSADAVRFLEALAGEDMYDQLLELVRGGLGLWLVAGDKDKDGTREAERLHAALPDVTYFPIRGAEADWNEYASGVFTANIMEFVEGLGEK